MDTLLEKAKREHDELHAWVMDHSSRMTDRSPEVQRLNRLRAQRDSLQERFNALCYKIKYIKKKQAELANAGNGTVDNTDDDEYDAADEYDVDDVDDAGGADDADDEE